MFTVLPRLLFGDDFAGLFFFFLLFWGFTLGLLHSFVVPLFVWVRKCVCVLFFFTFLWVGVQY